MRTEQIAYLQTKQYAYYKGMSHINNISTVEGLIGKIGRKSISDLGFREQDISRAITDGRFSSGWHTYIRDLCLKAGVVNLNNLRDLDRFFKKSTVPEKHIAAKIDKQQGNGVLNV